MVGVKPNVAETLDLPEMRSDEAMWKEVDVTRVNMRPDAIPTERVSALVDTVIPNSAKSSTR